MTDNSVNKQEIMGRWTVLDRDREILLRKDV